MKIKITDDKETLARMWDDEYAATAGTIREVSSIRPDGTAIADGWSYHIGFYTIVEENEDE